MASECSEIYSWVRKGEKEFRNPSKCLARGCKGDLAGEMMPCDESVFGFLKMRRERRREGKERLIGKVGGTRAICGNFRKLDVQDTQC
jgi:hypothetical protein